ncbi:hypothetical protein DF109_32485 [Burkholderia stagnalis]|uniref:SGNH/GDSL hydrolase family protein n=1 Tax=Burkholderia stagnalis TaxID=1503054 RepID=UPI000F5CE4B8|nr:SGNH/GDSL hydrolase family protein [Burkholderia stagnalis]RQY50973.1 hypothetical protein DF109_32485 [Burkholderia stagnalis]
MSNSTTLLDTISSTQANKEITANGLFDAVSPASLWGRRGPTTGGLTWGYYGGNFVDSTGTSHAIANGTLTLTASTTNYIYADNITGAVSINTTGFPTGKVPLYSVVTGTSTATSYLDYRSYQPSATGSGGVASNVTITSGSIGNASIVTPTMLSKWKAAKARVRSGVGTGRVLCVGDSITAGYGSQATGKNALCYPRQLASMLSAVGITAVSNAFIGYGPNGAVNTGTTPNLDLRISLGSWTEFTSVTGVGGYFFSATSSSNGTLSFTPTVNCDTFVIYWAGSSGNGSFSANISGGTPTTVSTNTGSGVLSKTTITGTLGANVLNLSWSSGGAVYIAGVEGYDSTKPSVSIINAGWSGSATSDWNNTSGGATYSPLYGPGVIAPDLIVVCLGINDWDLGTLSAFQTNLTAIVTQYKTYADVLLMSPVPTNPGQSVPGGTTPSTATQAGFVSALWSIANSAGVPVVDIFNRWQSFSAQNANSMYYDTVTHPDATGYADVAGALASYLEVA